ncbi:MAG: amylo-alpha-1,6-glucosidase [Candidatus Bipolaricaulia bacterium]
MADRSRSDMALIDLGRDIATDLDAGTRREWLVTNGIGGYACGTVTNLLTRSYHALLVAALDPPLGRTLLWASLDATVVYEGRPWPLFAHRWQAADGPVDPRGHRHIERFHLEGTTPVWTYALGDALIQQRIWMEPGANTTYVRYDLVRGSNPIEVRAKPLVNRRDHHATTRADDDMMEVEPVENGLRVVGADGDVALLVLSDRGTFEPVEQWHHAFYLSQEADRGLDPMDDHLAAGLLTASLEPGQSLTVAASTEDAPDLDGEAAYARRREHEAGILSASGAEAEAPERRQLILAADQFVVRREGADGADGRSIIAGYPWFGDWGRDTMIALPGLLVRTGRAAEAAQILRTYAQYIGDGLVPNRFPDHGETPEYHTADATLWFMEAIRAYREATGDVGLLHELFPVLAGIIERHRRGTRHGIGVDPDDGLLRAGEPGLQLTWMDAKVGDWVVTPRRGKPVEINALWYHGLRVLADFARDLGRSPDAFEAAADQALEGFQRFWDEQRGHCDDVLDGPDGHETKLRPNQLLAASLTYSPLSAEQQRAIVDRCARDLWTSHGLRSLAPDDPDYIGRYGGPQADRDAAYHQGTVWAWWIGPFVEAHLRAYQDPDTAYSYLTPLLRHLHDHGLGSVAEIFDGDPPHTPRGCFAQAWSVAELLRADRLIAESSHASTRRQEAR